MTAGAADISAAEIPSGEMVIRFIFGKHIRQDRSIRRQAFMPPKNGELSVTRKAGLTEEQIWAVGEQARGGRDESLKGRADLLAGIFAGQGLRVEAAPTGENPRHANVVKWPEGERERRDIADRVAQAVGNAGIWAP
jgi:hypothetical protein